MTQVVSVCPCPALQRPQQCVRRKGRNQTCTCQTSRTEARTFPMPQLLCVFPLVLYVKPTCTPLPKHGSAGFCAQPQS